MPRTVQDTGYIAVKEQKLTEFSLSWGKQRISKISKMCHMVDSDEYKEEN